MGEADFCAVDEAVADGFEEGARGGVGRVEEDAGGCCLFERVWSAR